MEPDIRKLLRRLDKAFGNAKFPGSHAARVGHPDEIASFLGKTWQEVTAADIDNTPSLIFFNERGLVYYLPSYLKIFATHGKAVRYWVFVKFISEMGDPSFVQRKHYGTIKELCSLFSEEQITIIRDFVQSFESFLPEPKELMSERPEVIQTHKDEVRKLIARALDYWNRCMEKN